MSNFVLQPSHLLLSIMVEMANDEQQLALR
jgi:hypothetical protein